MRRINNQLYYIEKYLIDATTTDNFATWTIVVGHYPIYSAGDHGDIYELKKYLLPLLEKYEVHAYICGHDHISEHLSINNINYFVSGAGSMTDKLGKTTSSANLHWYGVGYSAFSVMTATEESLSFDFIDVNGKCYSCTILWSKIRECVLAL